MKEEWTDWRTEVILLLQDYSSKDSLQKAIQKRRPECLKKSVISKLYKGLRVFCTEKLNYGFEKRIFPLLPPATLTLSVNEMCLRLFCWLECQKRDLFEKESENHPLVSILRLRLEEIANSSVESNESILLFQLYQAKKLISEHFLSTSSSTSSSSSSSSSSLSRLFKTGDTSKPSMIITTTVETRKQENTVIENIRDLFATIRQITMKESKKTNFYQNYTEREIYLLQKVFASALLSTDFFWESVAKSTASLLKGDPLDFIEEKVEQFFFRDVLFHKDGLNLTDESDEMKTTFFDALALWLSTFSEECGDVLDYRDYFQKTAMDLMQQFEERIGSFRGLKQVISFENLLGYYPDLFQDPKSDYRSFECPNPKPKPNQQKKSLSSRKRRR